MEELNYQKGLNAIEAGLFKNAITHFTNAINVEESIGAYTNRAFCYMNIDKRDLAKKDYEKSVEIAMDLYNKANKSDKDYVDLCLRDLIDAKATIALIERENDNNLVLEKLNDDLIFLSNMMSDNTILRSDLHISNFYLNRGMARLKLNKIDDGIKDIATGYIKSPSEKQKKEIREYGMLTGNTVKIEKCINDILSSNKDTNKLYFSTEYLNFEALGLLIKILIKKVNETTYNFSIPRPIPQGSYLSGSEYTMNIEKEEFIEDIWTQMPKTLDQDLEKLAFESLYQIIVSHIRKYNRILPSDLDSYIGQNILLFNAIRTAKNEKPLTTKEQEALFSKFNYMAFNILPESLKEIYKDNPLSIN